jgi:hypothetical protein
VGRNSRIEGFVGISLDGVIDSRLGRSGAKYLAEACSASEAKGDKRRVGKDAGTKTGSWRPTVPPRTIAIVPHSPADASKQIGLACGLEEVSSDSRRAQPSGLVLRDSAEYRVWGSERRESTEPNGLH